MNVSNISPDWATALMWDTAVTLSTPYDEVEIM